MAGFSVFAKATSTNGCGRMGGDNVGEDFQREFERLEADLMPEPRPDGQKWP